MKIVDEDLLKIIEDLESPQNHIDYEVRLEKLEKDLLNNSDSIGCIDSTYNEEINKLEEKIKILENSIQSLVKSRYEYDKRIEKLESQLETIANIICPLRSNKTKTVWVNIFKLSKSVKAYYPLLKRDYATSDGAFNSKEDALPPFLGEDYIGTFPIEIPSND